jgi:hypothetical protein
MKLKNLSMLAALVVLFLPSIRAMGTNKAPAQTPAPAAAAGSAQAADTGATDTITGKVIDREDIWNRRTNPLMGRPDWLEEIILIVSPSSGPDITISIKGEKPLIKYKMITTGSRGVFHVSGAKMPYALAGFEPYRSLGRDDEYVVPKKTVKPRPTPKPVKTAKPGPGFYIEIEGINPKQIVNSKALRGKAIRYAVEQYGMTDASFISETSFQGPVPPPGGYIYWGVKGRIKGVWHVWQKGYGLHKGTTLDNPHKYQKCNSPDTLITTPGGSVPVKDLKPGDLVMSDGKAVKILKVCKVRAINHKACRVVFDDGTVLIISPGHPLADGRIIGALKAGDNIGGRQAVKNEVISYQYDYTYDLLPDSNSGAYIANGIRVGSTLK